jgi:hypothetical protein
MRTVTSDKPEALIFRSVLRKLVTEMLVWDPQSRQDVAGVSKIFAQYVIDRNKLAKGLKLLHLLLEDSSGIELVEIKVFASTSQKQLSTKIKRAYTQFRLKRWYNRVLDWFSTPLDASMLPLLWTPYLSHVVKYKRLSSSRVCAIQIYGEE